MKSIVIVIGARPNFMKAFPVYESLKGDFKLTLIHTGQHFDEKMSDVFFNQLKFPKPDIHLILEKRTKAGDFDDKLYVNNKEYLKNKDKVINDLIEYQGELGQMGEIRDKLKTELEKIKPDLVIVFGDVTSTLSASLAANMLNTDIAHVESGLRSGDLSMPEEVNRILTDHITKYYFVTEQSGIDNLKELGIKENIFLVGNTMIDTQKKYLQQALNTKYHETLNVKSKEYVLITLHRPSNVDELDKLKNIFDDLEELSKINKLVYPIHPRTKNNLEKIGYLKKVENNKNIVIIEPLGYLEFTCLMANCKYVITDSGGIQEETTALNIPCFTLRENTERPCTLIENHGTNQLISKIGEIKLKPCKGSMDLWDGNTSKKIREIILNICVKILHTTENMCLENNKKMVKGDEDIGISHLMKAFYGSPSQNIYKFHNTIAWKYMKHISEVGHKTNYRIDLQYFKSLLYDINISNISMENTLFQHIRIGDIFTFLDENDIEKSITELKKWYVGKQVENLSGLCKLKKYIKSKNHYSDISKELPKNINTIVLVYSNHAFQIKKWYSDDQISRWLLLSKMYIVMVQNQYKELGYKVVHIQMDHTRDDILSLAGKMIHFSICGGGFSNLLGNLCLLNNGKVYPSKMKSNVINDFNGNMIDPELSYRLKLYENSKNEIV